MVPTNGIILLAKPVNVCANDAIGPMLRDDSQWGYSISVARCRDTFKAGAQG